MLKKLNIKDVLELIEDDPVRPHITAEDRTRNGREVYALYEDQYATEAPVLHEGPRAVICVAYTSEVPTNEDDLNNIGTDIAVFYTVWSYEKGAGRDIVFTVAEHIKSQYPDVKRYVTLSPLTEMAKNFHLKNGAKFIAKHLNCQNFEYF